MKKKIIIVALIVALIGAAAGFFLVKRGGGAGSDFPKPVEEYTAGIETVPSITASIEEGKEELLLSISASEKTEEDIKAEEEEKEIAEKEKEEAEKKKQEKEEKEKESEEESEEDTEEAKKREKEEKKKEKEAKKREKEEKKAQKKREKEEKKRNKEKEEERDADKEKEEATDTADVSQGTDAEPSEAWNKYYYQSSPRTIRVLEAYGAYLEEEGFQQVKLEGEEKPEGKEAEDNTFHVKYQRKCEEEGYLFSVELEYPLANDPAIQMYAVKAIREKAPAAQGKDGEAMTRERALAYLEGLDSTSLGLTKPLSAYYVVMDMGRSYIEGKDCYGINVYDKGASKESYFVQKYYLSVGDEELYSCDIDGVIRRLQPAKGTALAPSAEAAVSEQTTAGETPTATNYAEQDANAGGVTHQWNFGPPETEEEE